MVIAVKKKTIIIAAVTALAFAGAGTGIFYGVRAAELSKYKNMKINLPQAFTVTAHTGCMGTDDNSLEAMRKGAEFADIVEFDVRFNSDGAPVLTHDEPKGGEITLDEAFAELKKHENLKANIDLKEKTNLEKISEAAERQGVKDRIFFTGVEESDIEAVKTACPDIPFYLNAAVDKKRRDDKEYIMSLVETVKNSGAVGINLSKDCVSEALVGAFHENSLLVSVWTVDRELDMYRAISLSPDNITTRNPDLLRKILEK